MAPQDYAGRLPKPAVVASTLTLFALAFGALLGRLYIKIWVQKRFDSDDVLLIFAAATLCGATGLLFAFINEVYLVEALIMELPGVQVPTDFIQQYGYFHKFSNACLILLWTTVCSVKFSFLALFRKLVDRNHSLTMYWRIVLALNIVIWLFGIAGVIITCPYFEASQTLSCTGSPKTVGLSALLLSLDILTDISIIAIPVNLVWKIRVGMKQKVALALSLCLSFVMIIVTIVGIFGIIAQPLDVLWIVYWKYIESAVAIVMASVTAFRSLFIIRSGGREHHPNVKSYRLLTLLKKILSKRNKEGMQELSNEELPTRRDFLLPRIPGALMTGIRTFIRGAGVSQKSHASSIQSYTPKSEERGGTRSWWPSNGQNHNGIRVQYDVSLDFDRASCNQPEVRNNHDYV